MSLSEVDRVLLQRCLDGAPRAWQDFADRFLGLVVHVTNHTARVRGVSLDDAGRDDLVAEVFLELLRNDFAVLRRFRRNSSLATYLTVVARRVVVRRLVSADRQPRPRSPQTEAAVEAGYRAAEATAPQKIEDEEEVRRLMLRLDPQEANLVRMYHLEGKSYHEISQASGMAENSIGPALSRARAKMRDQADSALGSFRKP